MSPRFRFLRPLSLATLLAAAPLAGAADAPQILRTAHVPHDAAIAALTAQAGEARDLCAPGEELRQDHRGWVCAARPLRNAALDAETYQTFEMGTAQPGVGARFVAACLGPEDRLIGGTCVRKDPGGYAYFAATPTTWNGAEAIECALDGAPEASAVGIAVCLDVPPLR